MSVFNVCYFGGRRISTGYKITPKETIMNWVFETYSNVYTTAMMQDMKSAPKVKTERKSVLARIFHRG
jgi:hypothetical protein